MFSILAGGAVFEAVFEMGDQFGLDVLTDFFAISHFLYDAADEDCGGGGKVLEIVLVVLVCHFLYLAQDSCR